MATFNIANNMADTHEVENTPPILENYNMFSQDTALVEAVKREGAHWAIEDLTEFGQHCGSADWINAGFEANRVKPILESHDRYGHRIDEVRFHPAYHQLMAASKAQGLTSFPWSEPKVGAHVHRAAGCYMMNQVEAGHCCPITMTFASVPTIMKQENIAKDWLPKILDTRYDKRNVPDQKKSSVTIGMAMTEKQGGSDVRANSTKAYPIGLSGPGQMYELVGHKYFVSAPMSDAFLVLAHTSVGLSCFLVPRWRPDGSKNPLQLIRLKDKMGNAANASSETELRGALGYLIGEEGRGVRNIIEMVAMTRFDCLVASAGGMRQHMTQILHHTQHRHAFGKPLDQQPLMQNVLADMALEAEAATALAFRVARALDAIADGDQTEIKFARLAVPVGKYWNCKRQPGHAYEAMEIIGGSGTMENSIMPRLYREAPINSIWEGSGNVQCLDVLRVAQKEPDALDVFIDECEQALGGNPIFDRFVNQLKKQLTDHANLEYRARHIVEMMALSLQASLLLRVAPEHISHGFCLARLQQSSGLTYGVLASAVDCGFIIERARL